MMIYQLTKLLHTRACAHRVNHHRHRRHRHSRGASSACIEVAERAHVRPCRVIFFNVVRNAPSRFGRIRFFTRAGEQAELNRPQLMQTGARARGCLSSSFLCASVCFVSREACCYSLTLSVGCKLLSLMRLYPGFLQPSFVTAIY